MNELRRITLRLHALPLERMRLRAFVHRGVAEEALSIRVQLKKPVSPDCTPSPSGNVGVTYIQVPLKNSEDARVSRVSSFSSDLKMCTIVHKNTGG